MKNVTCNADDQLIERARQAAHAEGKTLNVAFREWLLQYTQQAGDAQGFNSLMKRLRRVRAGRHFARDESNER